MRKHRAAFVVIHNIFSNTVNVAYHTALVV